MAKFLLMTGPYAGHVTPSMPIARRLIERGHEVVWITGRQYKAKVECTGARFVRLQLPEANSGSTQAKKILK